MDNPNGRPFAPFYSFPLLVGTTQYSLLVYQTDNPARIPQSYREDAIASEPPGRLAVITVPAAPAVDRPAREAPAASTTA